MENLNQITVTSIDLITTVLSERGRISEMKERNNYGLSLCTAGQITYVHKGHRYVSNSTNAILLPKGQSYTLYGDKKGVFPLINFQCMDFSCDRFLVIPLSNPKTLLKDYEHIKALSIFEGNRAKILSIFYSMLGRLSTMTTDEKGILFPAMRYLEEHYDDPLLTNSILAEQAGISEVYFRQIFTRHYGITPRQYMIDIRIQRAKQLLTDAGYTVTAISEQCGFSSVYHFCRAFKERTGLTPTEYSRQTRIYAI